MRATLRDRIGCGLGLLALLAVASAARGDVFEDGGFHQFGGSCNNLTVRNSPSDQATHVDMIAGAEVLYNAGVVGISELTVGGGSIGESLYAYESSELIMSGGTVNHDVLAYDSSNALLSGGIIKDNVQAYDNSQLGLSGATIEHYLSARDTSQVTFSSGTIGASLEVWQSSQVLLSGGRIKRDLRACNYSQVEVSDGLFDQDIRAEDHSSVTISGGAIGGELYIGFAASLTLRGSDFRVDGEPASLGEYGTDIFPTTYGTVSGTLASGEMFSNEFEIHDDGQLILTPEPATLALLAVGGLGIFLRRKRRGVFLLGGMVLFVGLVAVPAIAGVYPQARAYQLGDMDDFMYEGPGSEDDVYLNPEYAVYTETWVVSQAEDFDELVANCGVPFTFTFPLLEGEEVVGATLTLAMRATESLVTTDGLWFHSEDASVHYGEHKFADLGWLPLPSTGESLRSVDVSNVAGESFLFLLQEGQLNGHVTDDCGVDYALLTIEVIPEPATLALLAAGGLGVWMSRRRRA